MATGDIMNIQGNNNSVGGLLMSGNDLNLPECSTQEKDDLTKLYNYISADTALAQNTVLEAS